MAGVTIRPQVREDLEAIKAVNAAAFAAHGNTQSFDGLREERDDVLSLVALDADTLVGHILFSPVIMETPEGPVDGMGLGQLAVSPDWQKQGIGSELSHTGIAELRARHCPFIIVVGHASYYPRFGFEAGSRHGVKCQWEGIPDETFMVLYLDQSAEQQQKLTGVASFDGL
jgi:putative acetyltransferase